MEKINVTEEDLKNFEEALKKRKDSHSFTKEAQVLSGLDIQKFIYIFDNYKELKKSINS